MIELKNCNTFFSRLLGFMFKKEIKCALLFNNYINITFHKKSMNTITIIK